MPPWAESVLDILDPRVLSLGALVVASLSFLLALWSFWRTSRLIARQTRIADLELKSRERVEASLAQADVRARLYEWGQHSHQIALENVSGAPAFNVDIEFLDEKAQGILLQSVREETLPVRQLKAGEPVTLLAALASGRWPPFRIALTWSDPDGRPRREEAVLYVP